MNTTKWLVSPFFDWRKLNGVCYHSSMANKEAEVSVIIANRISRGSDRQWPTDKVLYMRDNNGQTEVCEAEVGTSPTNWKSQEIDAKFFEKIVNRGWLIKRKTLARERGYVGPLEKPSDEISEDDEP